MATRTQLQWQLIRPYGRYAYYRLFPQRRPTYFKAAWACPPLPLRNQAARALMEGRKRPAFLFFPMTDWHARMQRSQQLAKALAETGHLCIYVNPHLGLEYETPFALSPEPRLCKIGDGIFEFHIHLPGEHEVTRRLF